MDRDGDLGRARAALREGRWRDACGLFEAALEERESIDALTGLADAHWWLCEATASAGYRERAWVLARRTGDAAAAGRAAIDLCICYVVNLGNDVAARGWLARAERVTAALDPNPVQGWLWLMGGYLSDDPDAGYRLTEQALDVAQRTGDADLELVALSDLGVGLVVRGRVDEGMAMLDEAMAGTLAGEYRRLDTVVFATCNMLAACQHAGDLGRATTWCRTAEDFMASYGCPFLYARCRVHYGGVLLAKGRWEPAEEQLRAALDMAADAGPGPRADALVQLAELRVRQGRFEEAEALLAMAGDAADLALPAAALRLARGQPAVAAGLLRRRARLLGDDHIEAPATLVLLVRALLEDGDAGAAADVAGRLRAVATGQRRGSAQALAALAAAEVAAAVGDRQAAIDQLDVARQALVQLELPHETARARLALARLLADEHPELAVVEATAALAAFEGLGASADADAAAAQLRTLGVRPRRRGPSGGELTAREQEVLRLVGDGLTNPEIAARLYISRKTVAHHVSALLAKLGLRNRAEAVAYAATHRDPSRA
ncbi:MAG TPA: LuxR C-terminal-related transcriptional regulator [Acidimicrobiales bacterium]